MKPPRHRIPWTKSQLDQLEALRMQGKSNTEIATVMGRTLEAIEAMASKRKMPRMARDYEAQVELYRTGISNKEAAKQLGITIKAVQHRKMLLRRFGYSIPVPSRKRH